MYGRKSFRELLENLVFIWENEREKIYSTADEITSHLQQQAVPSYNELPELNWEVEEKAVAHFRESFDSAARWFQSAASK